MRVLQYAKTPDLQTVATLSTDDAGKFVLEWMSPPDDRPREVRRLTIKPLKSMVAKTYPDSTWHDAAMWEN